MNRNILLTLAAIIALSLVVYLVAGRPPASDDHELGTPLLPGLKEQLDQVTGVAIRSAGGEVELDLLDERWVVTNRFNYPVDFVKLATLLEGLANAQLAERKTAKPENYHLLGLQMVDVAGSAATEVTIVLADGAERRVLIGRSGSGREGSFVRIPEEAQAWLVDQELTAASEVTGWLQPKIIDIDAERVESVQITAPDGARIDAVRGDNPEGNFELGNLPEGRKLRYATIGNTLGRALTNVRLKDVRPAEGFDFTGAGSALFRCSGGLIIEVASRADDDHYYLRFLPRVEPPDADPSEEVQQLTGALSPWVFEVAEYTFDQFTKRMEDLTEDAAPAAESP